MLERMQTSGFPRAVGVSCASLGLGLGLFGLTPTRDGERKISENVFVTTGE